MKQKIFQIGFNKCGTVSLYALFKDHCKPLLPCLHWQEGKLALQIENNLSKNLPLLTGYENNVFFSDMEAVYYENNYPKVISAYKYFHILDQQYPNSKFILNTRDINKWVLSRVNFKTFLIKMIDNELVLGRPDYEYILYYMDYYDTTNINDIASLWKNEYLRHVNNVRKYFANRPNDLLEYNLDIDSLDKMKDFFKDDGIIFTTDSLPVLNRSCDQKWFKGNA